MYAENERIMLGIEKKDYFILFTFLLQSSVGSSAVDVGVQSRETDKENAF